MTTNSLFMQQMMPVTRTVVRFHVRDDKSV
jgi:hypothetical protein